MTRTIVRKVLHRDDFGTCVLLPKTEWRRLPASGSARILVDGTSRRITVEVEECDCQGTGLHEHRFLRLEDGAATGDSVQLGLPDHQEGGIPVTPPEAAPHPGNEDELPPSR